MQLVIEAARVTHRGAGGRVPAPQRGRGGAAVGTRGRRHPLDLSQHARAGIWRLRILDVGLYRGQNPGWRIDNVRHIFRSEKSSCLEAGV